MAEIIPHWLTKQAELKPNHIAIEMENGDEITFLQLKEQSQQLAKKLASLSVTQGTHIGIRSTNNVSMVIAIHALSYLGAVSVMLNTKLTKAELTYQIDDAEVAMVLTCESLAQSTRNMELPVPVKTFTDVELLTEKEVALRTEIDLADTFTILYTSGTTGFPKGVIHTYGNHWWSAMGSALNLGLSEQDKWLAVLPLFHISGLSILIKSVIYGMPVFLVEKFAEAVVHDAIINKGVTIASVVTVMVQRLIDSLDNKQYPKAFRCMLLGGGSAPVPLLEKAKQNHIPVFQSYGMTETTSQIVTLSPLHALEKIGSAGKPLFPAQLSISNPGDDTVGEIHVKGPMVTKGYFKNEAATKQSIKSGWLATGDLGYMDGDGFLYVVDRRNDLIISGGENIYPSEIESVLSGMKQIKEVGVTGKDDEMWGQVPVAFVVVRGTVSAVEIIRYAEKYLAKYKLPKDIYFVDGLPRNASNKLVRKSLAKWI
ncbi:O-succinylbenzoic acid--CoA ligase [Virgibacillus halotolerans]|uniref:o-succinylbenzoate--CoA ligase n=1 Tax=Virgibacillus halotolerans TaxID=1071053 RepID=UPI00196072B6|nr:o-succinylbenzoate--CoA ligase [Virgibacillus halotolerans]MBM7600728.1 O-succinylbenzoic acid--CoA ligase [Virgibacillus halotolerans]